jgi:hypothetical protein
LCDEVEFCDKHVDIPFVKVLKKYWLKQMTGCNEKKTEFF